jgi:hypothetical protein
MPGKDFPFILNGTGGKLKSAKGLSSKRRVAERGGFFGVAHIFVHGIC